MKKRNRSLIPAITLMSFLIAGCATQTRSLAIEAMSSLSSPRFGFVILNFPSESPDSSIGRLRARIRYDDLIFVKNDSEGIGSSYTAHYQLSVNFYSDKALTDSHYSKTFDHRLTVPNYVRTRSTAMFDTVEDQVALKPGRYFVAFRLLDLNTNITSSREVECIFRDFFHDPVDISDILLYNRADTTAAEVTRTNADTLFAGFYVTTKTFPAKISLHLIAKSAESPTFIDTSYEVSQTVNLKYYRLPLNITGFRPANYDLRISASEDGKENHINTAFTVARNSPSVTARMLGRELGPLVYITTAEKVDSMEKAAPDERDRMITNFWLTQGHNDSTVANAMEKEFYKRVESVNEEFGTELMQGWQTDRGRIFILYGKPDQVEDHVSNFRSGPAANVAPYQVWYYRSLKLRFVFVDESRNGNYRLAKNGGT